MSKNKINYLEPIAIAVGGIAATQTIPLWKDLVNSNALVLFFSALTSVVIYNIMLLMFRTFPKLFFLTRKIVDKRANYEGFYLEVKFVDDKRSYAIVRISYNFANDDYHLSGTSYESDGTIGINWKSNFVKIDTNNKKIIYAQTGHLTHTSDGKIFDGVTYMNFNNFSKNEPVAGIGHYVDTIPAKSDFDFQKISEELCKKLIGKSTMDNRKDCQNFVITFHKENPNPIFTWEKD